MSTNTRRSSGFTLIELLVVVLILGILLAIAIPAYLSSLNASRTASANTNGQAVATAVQSYYVSQGGKTYVGADLANATIVTDLGGQIPANPCGTNTVGTVADYTFGTATAGGVTITPVNTFGCTTAPSAIKLGTG